MKILIIASGIDYYGSDGGSSHLSEVVNGLKSVGVECDVVCGSIESNDSFVFCVPRKRRFTKRTADPLSILFDTFRVAQKLVKTYKYDLIYERMDGGSGTGTILSRVYGIPLVIELNSPYLEETMFRGNIPNVFVYKLLEFWRSFQWSTSKLIVTTVSSIVDKKYRDRLYLTEWGVNLDVFRPLKIDEEYDVLFVSSMHPWHGARDIFDIAQRVDAQFYVIGDGMDFGILKDSVRNLKNVHLLGSVSHNEIVNHINRAKVCIAPFNDKYYEPLKRFGFYWSPIKLFEYMACGKAIVSTDITGRILKHNVTALLSPCGDIDAFAGHIDLLLKNKGLRGKLGKNLIYESRNYSWKVHVLKLKKAFNLLV